MFIILRRIICNMESKIFLSNGTFSYPMFANCVHAQNDVGQKCSRFGEIRFGDIAEIAKIVVIAETTDIPEISKMPRLPRLPAEIAKIAENAGIGEIAG